MSRNLDLPLKTKFWAAIAVVFVMVAIVHPIGHMVISGWIGFISMVFPKVNVRADGLAMFCVMLLGVFTPLPFFFRWLRNAVSEKLPTSTITVALAARQSRYHKSIDAKLWLSSVVWMRSLGERLVRPRTCVRSYCVPCLRHS